MSRLKDVFDQITEDRNKRGNGTAQATGTTNSPRSNLEKAMERINRQREAEQERKKREEEEAAAREEQLPQEPAEPERKPRPIPAVVPEQAEGAAQASRDLLQRQRTMAAYDRDTRNALPQEAVNKAMAARAKEEYDKYMASDEYQREKVSQGVDSASSEAEYYAALAGKGTQTDREKELKARADYYARQAEADEDKKVLEGDLAELESWPEEDQQALKTYLSDLPAVGINTPNARELIRKYGLGKVREMAESLSRSQNAKLTAQTERNAREKAGSGIGGAIAQSAASVPAGIVGAVGGPVAVLGDLMHRTGRYNTLDPNNNQASAYAGAVREQVAEDIAGDGNNPIRKGLSYAYQGGMSALDTGARLLVSGGNPAVAMGLAAAGSFGQEVSEASKQGASPMEALGHGAASATIEALTEKLPLDELVKTAKGGGKGVAQAITSALKQAGIEATTEEISLLGSLASEAAILREKSSYKQRIGELVTGGMSYQQAKEQADREILEQAKQTAIVSGLSGGMSSLGASVAGNLSDRLGGPQTAETARGETAQEASETGHQAFLNRMLQGIRPQQQEAEAPKPEGLQRVEATYRATMGNRQAEMAAEQRKAEAEWFPSETPVQKVIENLERQRQELETQIYAASEAGDFGTNFQQLTQQWDELTRQIKELDGADSDRVRSLEAAEAPPERVMPHDAWRDPAFTSNPLEGRTEESVGSRSVKAYQYENPAVKPYFQDAARGILSDIDGSTRGEKTFNEQLHYESGGEKGWSGTKRNTTEDIADIKDTYGYTWDELREAAEDIIHDRGKENNAASKRLEFMIHDRLANGYTDVEGRSIPANRDYLNFLEERQVNEYRRESMDDLVANGDRYAPKGSSRDFDAMGAASGWFSPFTRMQHEYGNIPDGENAVRSDDMPVSTDGSDRVSYTARTVKGAAATPEEFIGDLENLVVKGGMSYIPITNDATAQAAADSIRRLGWEESLAEWRAKVRSGKAGPDLTATGAILLNNAANAGDKQTWLSILDDYRKLGTNTAQGLQAFRILKKLAPDDKLYLIRKSINQMVEDMHLDGDITVDEDLEQAYREAETEEARDKALVEIQKDVAAQIPSTAMDKWTALRYVNMLGNFRTQVRNIAGNIGAQSAYRVKDTIAASIEAVVNKASGGKLGRTKSLTVGRGLLKAAAKDFDNLKGAVLDGGKYADSASESSDFIRGVQEQRTIFKSDNKALDTMMKPMEGYRRATNWAMNNGVFGDAAFGRAAYARALAGYLKANGVKGDSLEGVDGKLLDKARAYAAREAQEATFRDNNAVSDWISRIGRRKDTPKAAKVIAEGIMPFRKTPANVLVRAEEFSPLGLINATVKTVQAAKGGEVTGTDVVNSWAKALTGTGLTILGAALGNAGLLIGGPDEDEDEAAFDDLNGYQNYALLLPDGTNLTIDFLSPVAMPLFLGAQIQKIAEEGGYQLSDLEGVFLSLADPMIQMSMLQGVNDTLDNIKYSENNMGQFLLNAATSYLTQGITNTLMGQLERSSEDVRMTTYVDQDSQLSPWVQRQLGKISQKIPGWDFQQMPYRNAWGETEKNPEGAWDYLYNLLSPSYISQGKTDELAKELKRLNEVQSDVNVFPDTPETKLTYTDKDGNLHEDYNLSQEQWQTMAETEGKTQNRIAKALTESADYKALTDEQKAKAISLCYEYAREKGRMAALEDYPGLSESWMEAAEGDEAASIIRKVAGDSISGAFAAMTESWRNGRDGADAAGDLEEAYKVYQGLGEEARKAMMKSASGRMGYYLEAREAGVETETFVGLYKTYWDIDQGSGKASEKATKWAYELERATESGLINEQQKDAMKDSMVYYQMFPAETEKFDQMTEAGLSAGKALDIGKLLQGLKPEGGRASVTAAQQAEAIAAANLTDSEKAAVMKLYLNDTQDQNLDDMASMGYGPEEYAAAYRIYTDERDTGGKGTKQRTIDRIAREFRVDQDTARAIYEIYG